MKTLILATLTLDIPPGKEADTDAIAETIQRQVNQEQFEGFLVVERVSAMEVQ